MDQRWLDSLIADAELVADASLRLTNTTQPSLLNAISSARVMAGTAVGDADRETAYRSLQTELPEALHRIEPVTLFDLQRSWIMNRGFRAQHFQLYFFWLLSIALLFAVAYTTSLYVRASEISNTLIKYQDVRLAEQGVLVFNLARQHQDEIIAIQSGSDQALASASFFRALIDLQTTQNRIGATITAANEIVAELQFAARLRNGLCQLWQAAYGLFGNSPGCTDPNLAFAVAAGADIKKGGRYTNVPPEDFPGTEKGPLKPMPELVTFLDSADLFFQDVGVGSVQTRYTLPMFDFLLRQIKDLLDDLRSWIVPAAYGSLGAAIFFTRRILNPMSPNPDPLRVIYRILFGGFAGIIFAWFWSPALSANVGGSSGSISSFGIAFLAGYSTDILFQLLDRMVQGMGQQVQGRASTAPAK